MLLLLSIRHRGRHWWRFRWGAGQGWEIVEGGNGRKETDHLWWVLPEAECREQGGEGGAGEDVADRVLLGAALRTSRVRRDAYAMPVCLQSRTEAWSQLSQSGTARARKEHLRRINGWWWSAENSVWASMCNSTWYRLCMQRADWGWVKVLCHNTIHQEMFHVSANLWAQGVSNTTRPRFWGHQQVSRMHRAESAGQVLITDELQALPYRQHRALPVEMRHIRHFEWARCNAEGWILNRLKFLQSGWRNIWIPYRSCIE